MCIGCIKIRQLAVVHLDDAVGMVEIFVIVADGKNGVALRFQHRQQLLVKHFAKVWVLVGSPFV